MKWAHKSATDQVLQASDSDRLAVFIICHGGHAGSEFREFGIWESPDMRLQEFGEWDCMLRTLKPLSSGVYGMSYEKLLGTSEDPSREWNF